MPATATTAKMARPTSALGNAIADPTWSAKFLYIKPNGRRRLLEDGISSGFLACARWCASNWHWIPAALSIAAALLTR